MRSVRSILLQHPTAAQRELAVEEKKKLELHADPPEDILLLGHMVEDVKIMEEMMQGLVFNRDDYRGSLRVAKGAAKRFSDRCARLLGEAAE